MRIEQHQKIAVDDGPAALVGLQQAFACEVHPQAAREVLLPLLIGHLRAVRFEPGYVLHLAPTQRSALEEMPPPQHRMLTAHADHALEKLEGLLMSACHAPIDP